MAVRTTTTAALLLAALAFASCRTVPHTPQSALDALAASPGAHLTGTPAVLASPQVLNREDFVYDARPSPDAKLVALSRLGMKSFHLALHALGGEKPEKKADVAVNTLEFDVEALDFSPDGRTVATVSRDGALRLYAAADGHPVGAWLTEEPLVSVAWHPSGDALALGSAKGLVTVVSFPAMGHVAELRPHQDEVRGLAFAPSGTLFSGGWDKRIVRLSLDDAQTPARVVRTHFSKKNGLVLFRAVFDQAASGTVTIDARLPLVVLRGALAQAAGIDVPMVTETVTVPTALGNQVAKLVKNRRVAFKGLVLDADVAVCDACVPADAQGVIGAQVLDRLELAFDESSSELQLTAKEGAAGVTASAAKNLVAEKAFRFEGAVNDLSLDAKGAVLGVAFSETKAERTREVYEREKRKEVEPEREWDCAARVDASSGAVLEKLHGHRGVVASVAISPDGKTLASGGWDKKLVLHASEPFVDDDFGWALRRVRFSRDGRWLVAAAWTPQNPLNDHQSDPSAVVYEVVYREASVER